MMSNRISFPALMMGLLISTSILAQPGAGESSPDRGELREKMEALAIGFLTDELQLDAESAKVFWPIYNAHMDEMKEAGNEQREVHKVLAELEDGKSKSGEFNAALDRLEAADIHLAQLRTGFLRDVADEFGPVFAIRCMEARKKFERQMRSRMQQRMSAGERRAPGKKGRAPGRQ